MTACIDPELVEHANEALAALKAGGFGVVTAESCTAGLIAACLAQGEGAGELLHGGFVTYTKAHKTTALGVPRDVLDAQGSVNEAVARALACGALERSPAEIALAVTGVLGPSPDEDGNPVGLVYLACCIKGREPRVRCKDYGGQAHDVLRRRVVLDALDLLKACATD